MKKFDPKKCPYEQLKKHRGRAIIFWEPVFTCKEGRAEYGPLGTTKGKIRVVSSNPDVKYRYGDDPIFCLYSCASDWDTYRPSCVNQSSYEKTIAEMKRRDKRKKYWDSGRIVHIDFYPEDDP